MENTELELIQLYSDQDYDILILNNHGFVLFTVTTGSMCIEMINLIEDNTDLDDVSETKEHALMCKYVLRKYSDNIKAVGYYDETRPEPTFDYDVTTEIDLTTFS